MRPGQTVWAGLSFPHLVLRTELAGLVGRSQDKHEVGESRTRWNVQRRHRMNGTTSVSHGLPAVIFSDTGDLHLQAKVPFVTEINTHLAQELEKPWRRFGRSGGVVGPSLPHTRQMSRRMSCHSS